MDWLRFDLDLDSLLQEIVEGARRSLDFGTVVLYLMDKDSGQMQVRAHASLDDEGRQLLEGAVYTWEEVAGLMRALRLFEQQPFDLLITDYKMPGTDGMTLAARVRQLYPRAVIIMITAYGDETLREQAARASIRRVLDKPVGLAEVRCVALKALGRVEEL